MIPSHHAGAAALSIPKIFCLALALGAVAAVHAAMEARDLNADASLYLLSGLSEHGLVLNEPARKTVQFLQESFAYLGYLLGVTDLVTLGRLLTLGTQGWPLMLTGLGWLLLPPAEKGWILGPLLNVAVVIPVTSFMGIGEGMVASSLMWLLFLLLEFERGWFRLLAAAVLAAASFYLHEASFPFMIGIALLAASRAWEARGLQRACLCLVALLALSAAGNLVYLIPHPPGASNGSTEPHGLPFLRGLFGEFLVTSDVRSRGVHLPALAGMAVSLCLLLVHFPVRYSAEKRERLLRAACRASLGFFVLVAVLFLIIPEWITISRSFMAARGLPTLTTTVMALAIHWLRRAGWTPDRLTPAPVRAVLAGIIPMHFVIQTVLTVQWAAYQKDLSALVASREGIIDWQNAAEVLDPRHEFLRGALVWAWSIQPLSIVLAPGGRVRSAVDARPNIGWKPFRLDDPTTLPRCVRGLDWSRYLATLRYTGTDPKAGCPG